MTEGRRRTRPWAALKGPTALDNDLASLLRTWMDNADLTIDRLKERLTADHFPEGRVPSRTTLASRFSGVALDDAFVEAVADACSSNAEELQALLTQAHDLKVHAAGTFAPPAATSVPSLADWVAAARAGTELSALQNHYVAAQDRLVRALERSAELERERSSANQLILVLLALVEKLHRDIDNLHSEEAPRFGHARLRRPLDEIHAQLSRSEQQRTAAEAELERARAERRKADELAREAAEQVAGLRAQIEQLRHGRSLPEDAPSPAGVSAGTGMIRPHPDDATPDDVDTALAKAAWHLDKKADRLDLLADELRQDNPPDNSPTSINAPDNLLHRNTTGDPGPRHTDEDEQSLARQHAMKQEILQSYWQLRADRETYCRTITQFPPSEAYELGALIYQIATPEEGELVWSTYGSHALHLLAFLEKLTDEGWGHHATQILVDAARGRKVGGLLQLIDEMEVAGTDPTPVLSDIAIRRATRDIPPILANLSLRDRRSMLADFRTHRSIGDKQELVRAMHAANRPDWEIFDVGLASIPAPFAPTPTTADAHPTLRLRIPPQS